MGFRQGRMKHVLWLTAILSSLLVSSCQTIHPSQPTSVQRSIQTLQEGIDIDRAREKRSHPRGWSASSSVDNALLPPLSHYVNPAKQTPPRFDVTANNVPAKEFFMGLVAGTKYNMVVNPNVTGTITMNLKDVTIQEAMEAVRDIYKYDYHRTSYGYEVLQPQLENQVFHINYLDIQRNGRSYMQLTTGQVSNKVGTVTAGGQSTNFNNGIYNQPLGGQQGQNNDLGTISSVETKSEMRFWKDMQKSIENMVGKESGHSVTVNPQAGVIAIRAFPGELRRVSRYINSLETSLNRQVILEAKILEVDLDDSYQAGIDWAVLGNPAQIDPLTGLQNTTAGIGQNSSQVFEDTDLKALNGIFAIRINGNFKTLINLLQTQGNVQVLSSPHISTVNNQKAVIKVGQDEFFVTGVSTSNTIIGTNTLPSQDVSLTPFFSGITLDVTPEISHENTVILHIHPSVSRVVEQTKVIGLGTSTNGQANNLTLPLAKSTIRESDNIVRARNGQVVVIGGLMQNNMVESIASTPWLGNIPFLGSLFRRTQQVSQKSELVILLRPVVASNQNFISRMENEKKEFKILQRPFHAGGMPKLFGNEAERGQMY